MPITSSHSYYQTDLYFPHTGTCTASELSEPTLRDLRAGQRVTDWELVPYSCPA